LQTRTGIDHPVGLAQAAAHEVAELAAYLCSPAGSYITGALAPLDGGEHLRGASIQEPA
jgi:NAD(P)-dependent dehydrogenase (short-subunit alcohol dehydrogenase family)